MSLSVILTALGLLSVAGLLNGVPQGGASHGVQQGGASHGVPQGGASHGVNPTSSSRFPYEEIKPGKYAAVIASPSGWNGARRTCESDLNGASLFSVTDADDSYWLGQRINLEKDRFTGSSKFWIGLTSQRGRRKWLNGLGYVTFAEVVQIAGDEDAEKIYAWAVPDSKGRIKYEFLTQSDEAEAFICQYPASV